MDDRERQVEEFGGLWKLFVSSSNEDKIREEFPRIYKLTTMEISIISIVYSSQDVILREICTELEIPKSTLTSAVDRLERLNYVNRVISNRDRRSYGLKLTEEGYEVQNEHLAFERKLYGYLLNSLDTNEEREMLLQLLRKIVKNS